MMKIAKTNISPTELKLLISASETELAAVKKHVLSHFAHGSKIQGFRPGKAPLHVVEKSIDQQALHNEFLEHAMNGLYRKALEAEDVRPVAEPKVALKKFIPYTQLEFEVETEVLGKVSLPDYKKIKVPKQPIKVLASDVNEVLQSLQKRLAQRTASDVPAKEGDEVVIDFAGRDNKGQPVAGAEGKDYPLILGSKQFIPGFEEQLTGLKKDDEKEFKLTFPSDYGVKSLQSKKVTFKVNIKEVNELKVPKLDDEIAKKAGPFKTLAELKEDIKKQLLAEREIAAGREHENAVIDRVASQASVDIPKTMIDEQVVAMEEEEKRNLAYRGQTWTEHLAEEGINDEEHRARHRPQAEARVKAGLVLSEIAEQEKVTVTPEELEVRMQILKGQYKDEAMQAELDKPETKNDIAARLLTEKTITKLIGYTS